MSTRCEVRMPGPSCNPYLALAAMMAAGLDGVKRELHPGAPINKNIFTMSNREKRRLTPGQSPDGTLGIFTGALLEQNLSRRPGSGLYPSGRPLSP